MGSQRVRCNWATEQQISLLLWHYSTCWCIYLSTKWVNTYEAFKAKPGTEQTHNNCRLRCAALEDKLPNFKDLIPIELFPSYTIVWCALGRKGLLKAGDLDAQVASHLTLYHLKHAAFKATLVSMEHCLVFLRARNDFIVWPLCEWLKGAKFTSAHILLART